MPFRERVKRAFGRKDSISSDGNDLGKSSSRKASNIYQPGETMPKPKYRQPVDKKHKEALESFSFAGNVRRKSVQSLYSPMGSRMPSRTSSFDHTWAGLGRRYPPGIGSGMLAESITEGGDIANVGGIRNHSLDLKASEHHENASSSSSTDADSVRPVFVTDGTAGDHSLFSADDFHKALQRATSRQRMPALVV